MVMLSVKFTILIRIPLILLSELMKLTSISGTELYNSMDRSYTWKTNIRVKGSDRRPFILALDLILVYVTLIM